MLDYNKVYKADSDIMLQELIDRNYKFDLILTDPPYNLNKDFGNKSDSLSLEQFLSINKSRIHLCHKLLDKNGSLIWFGIHKFIGFLQVMMYEDNLFYRGMNIWNYENGFSRSKKFQQPNMNLSFGFQIIIRSGHITQMMSEYHIKVKID